MPSLLIIELCIVTECPLNAQAFYPLDLLFNRESSQNCICIYMFISVALKHCNRRVTSELPPKTVRVVNCLCRNELVAAPEKLCSR